MSELDHPDPEMIDVARLVLGEDAKDWEILEFAANLQREATECLNLLCDHESTDKPN